MATRYPSFEHRKQTFRRSEARDAGVRREVASWPDGIPPTDPEPEITYAPNLLPDAPGFVHGIVQEAPVWVVQCDGCGRVAVGESRTSHGQRTNRVILFCGIHFGDTHKDPRRLCARCRVEAGWNDFDTSECRNDGRKFSFHEAYMQEREPGLFDLQD
jgi:hypothetical protein